MIPKKSQAVLGPIKLNIFHEINVVDAVENFQLGGVGCTAYGSYLSIYQQKSLIVQTWQPPKPTSLSCFFNCGRSYTSLNYLN